MNLNQITINNTIKQISEKAALSLSNVAHNGFKQIKEYSFDCSELDDFRDLDITESEKYKQLFDDLKKITGPALYYFEVLSDHSTSIIVSRLQVYSDTEHSRACPPATSKNNFVDNKILYVGKVKRYMSGRFIQHLGFHKAKSTQGLQLFHWAKDLSLSLKLTVLEFEPNMINLMTVLENEVASELKPILGKHK
jgi:hypothetical protein